MGNCSINIGKFIKLSLHSNCFFGFFFLMMSLLQFLSYFFDTILPTPSFFLSILNNFLLHENLLQCVVLWCMTFVTGHFNIVHAQIITQVCDTHQTQSARQCSKHNIMSTTIRAMGLCYRYIFGLDTVNFKECMHKYKCHGKASPSINLLVFI